LQKNHLCICRMLAFTAIAFALSGRGS